MKSKPQQLTYTLAPVSARSSSHHNHHDQISCVTSGTPSKTFNNPQQDLRLLRTKIPMEEAILQLSDLNTSGANTTICEYVKILGDNNNHLAGEDIVSSLHSSWSEDYKKQIERIRRNNEGRIGRRDGFDQVMELQRFRKKGSTNYKSLEKQLASKPMATAPGRDDSATVIEFTDFIGYTEGNPVEKENVPEVVKREKLVVGKIAIPPKARSQEKKNSFQQQSMISKIAGGSSHQNISSSTSASITARRLREEPNVNRSQGFEAATLSSRLMNSRVERENYQTQPNQPSSGSLIKPLIQLTSPQLNPKKSKKRTEAVYKSALSHRNSQSSNISSLQNPNRSSQKKFNPVPAPVSRSVQAIVTPRGHYFIQNEENQKPLASIKEEPNKLIENKRALSKGEIKSKRDSASKVMKATKIDLVEMDISKKSGQRRRNERVEECAESIEVIYGMLKKAFKEKKEEISHSEHCIQKLEGLKTYMIEAISSINGLKSE